MSNQSISSMIVVFFLGVSFGLGMVLGQANGYKQGQVDALNEKVCYELIELDNRETEWQRTGNESCPFILRR